MLLLSELKRRARVRAFCNLLDTGGTGGGGTTFS
jgi:hypothetical protein